MDFLPFVPEAISCDSYPSMKILKIVHSHSCPAWSLPAHVHPDQTEIVYIVGGKATYTVNNYPYHVQKGDLLIFDSNVVHSLDSDYQDPIDVWSCTLRDFELPGKQPNHIIDDKTVPVFHTGDRSSLFEHIYKEIFYQRSNEKTGYYSVCHMLASTLMTLCIQLAEEPAAAFIRNISDTADNIRRYLDEHYSEPITMTLLSNEFHISQSRLSHLFNEAFQTSPISYAIDKRMHQAQWELVSTQATIKEIAANVGYDNVYHFTKLFTERCGISPSAMREQYTIPEKSRFDKTKFS